MSAEFPWLSADEYARIAFDPAASASARGFGIRGLHLAAPRESSQYRWWLRHYLSAGPHPIDVGTYLRPARDWEEPLACRNALTLWIRQGRIPLPLLDLLLRRSNAYDRDVFNQAHQTVVRWAANGNEADRPERHLNCLVSMAAGCGEDVP